LYIQLAAYDVKQADHVLNVGATLYQYLNKDMKYSAYIEPYGFRQFQNLVTETESLLTSERKRVEEKKQKLFKKGYS